MRKYYIDNLRWMTVLLLFPYHTLMVYNSFGENFYVKGPDLAFSTYILGAMWAWIMPLLFMVSGMGSFYSLQKRTVKEYLKERVERLLLPLVSGILLLLPIQTFIAEKYHNSYTGGYLKQYVLFFTKPTDLTGYTGGFTPGHLWFILYLFVISLVSSPLMRYYIKSEKKIPTKKMSLPIIMLLFIVPLLSQPLLDIAGKSVGEYLAWFLIGFFVISDDEVQEKLQKHRVLLTIVSVVLLLIYGFFGMQLVEKSVIVYEILYGLNAHVSILAIIGNGKQYLNFNNRASQYLTKSSFSIYLFHQQWVVIAAYFSLMYISNLGLQMVVILVSSIVFTFLSYFVLSKVPFIRYIFGLTK